MTSSNAPAMTSTLSVSDSFLKSLAVAATYPANLLDKSTYLATLKAYQNRLDNVSDELFAPDETDAEVGYRDWYADPATQAFDRYWVRSLADLQRRHGVQHIPSQGVGPNAGFAVTRRDPRCRFVFIHAIHSQARLKITKQMLLELLTFHQVMPSYLEFLFLFGQSSGPKDLRFSGFREQTSLSPRNASTSLASLGRSSRQYELCYNLKAVDLNPTSKSGYPWSIRQAGIYHKFDAVEGTTLWMMTKGNLDLKERIQEITGRDGRYEDRCFNTAEDSLRSSLAIHLMLIHWSCESWRWYIQWLEDKIDKETEHALYGNREKQYRQNFNAKHLQDIQTHEDKVHEASMVIDANMEVITALREYYEGLLDNKDFPLRTSCADIVAECTKQMKTATYDLKMQSSRASVLARLASGRKNLILQHLQAQTAESMEGLTRNSIRVGIAAQNEAIVMRIITVVTLIFLPATFVSTFFSTDVVKYQNQDGSGVNTSTSNDTTYYSSLAMYRWLQVAGPLTGITLVFAWIAYRWEKKKQAERRGFDIV